MYALVISVPDCTNVMFDRFNCITNFKMDRSKSVGTKKQLLTLIDDVDLIVRQLFETLAQQSNSDSTAMETDSNKLKMDAGQLTDLLIQKNNALLKLTVTAREQQKLYKQIQNAQAEIAHQDQMIGSLQKHLKQAEYLLASALHQAKEQLRLFDEANERVVMSEDVISYAHQISASCSTAAPLNWTPGDPRRPYPQDIQMRCGWLGQISNTPVDNDVKPPAQLGTDGIQMPKLSQPDSRWQNSSDLSGFSTLKGADDVDVMSSDSSTSDSSDSSVGND